MNEQYASLPIASLIADPDVWPRHSWDEERVALFADLYAANGADSLPPIVVVAQDDRFIVADGWTRARAALLAKLTNLPARVVELPADSDVTEFAYRIALETASAAARPLTNKERRAAVVRLLAWQPRPSDHEIARLAGFAHTTVGRVRKTQDGQAPSKPHRENEPGESHLAEVSAEEIARGLFSGLRKLEDARGISDLIIGDQTARRLADLLVATYGDDALDRATAYKGWFDGAIARLRSRRETE